MRKLYRYAFEEPYRLDPTPLYETLRKDDPVARVTCPYGEEGWLITRHKGVKAVFGDRRFSRAAVIAAHERIPRSSPPEPGSNPMSSVDPPEQSVLRKLVAGAFTKRQAKRHRPLMQQIADRLVDDMAAAGPPVDLVATFTSQFPVMVIGEIFGVPPSDRLQFRDWAVPILSRSGRTQEEIDAARARLRQYVTELAADKRANPQDDLLSTLVQGQARERRVSDELLIDLVVSLLLNDSVANQLANSLYLLLTHADQLGWLRSHMSRMPQAVEEMLRYAPLAPDAPVGGQGHIRMAMVDMELDGMPVRKGDFILPAITSANRDELVFTDAHRFDLSRSRNPHLAFGYGIHHCPGAELSRMELQVAVSTLLERFPDLRLSVPVEELPWKIGMVVRGPRQLPVRW